MQIHRSWRIPLPEGVFKIFFQVPWRLSSSSHILLDVQAAQIMLRVGDLRSYCRFMAQVGIRIPKNGGPVWKKKKPSRLIAENFINGRWLNYVKFGCCFFCCWFFSKTYGVCFFGRFPYNLLDAQKEFPGTPFWWHEGLEMLQMEGGSVKGKINAVFVGLFCSFGKNESHHYNDDSLPNAIDKTW